MSPRFPMPKPELDVPWERVPKAALEFFKEQRQLLNVPGVTVKRGKVRESFSVYSVTFYITPDGADRSSYGLYVVSSYNGDGQQRRALVRVGDEWVRS